ncbi:MAG: hypothetical protein H6684_14410 [Deltaproteobacteria bacterium]|nr:hypothetical protein [Deltaproteobacteria bacterium]
MSANWRWMTAAILAALAAAFVACGGGDDDDDDDDSAPGLVWSEDFESEDLTARRDVQILSNDPDKAFPPGIDGRGFWLGDGNNLMTSANGRVPRDTGTLEFWFQPRAPWTDNRERRLFSIGGAENFSIFKDDRKSFLNFVVDGHGLSFFEDADLIGSTLLTSPKKPYLWASGWNHVAVVWQDLGQRTDEGLHQLYVNGELMNEETGRWPSFDYRQNIILGGLSTDTQPDAIIDDIRVYNYAKTPEQIADEVSLARLRPATNLDVVPVPLPAGALLDETVDLGADAVTIVAPPEWYASLADLVGYLQDAVEEAVGTRPAYVRSDEYDGAGFAVAVGNRTNSSAIRRFDKLRAVPSSRASFGDEGYLVDIRADGIAIASPGYAGAVHGLTSLLRLVPRFHGVMPAITLADKPDFAIRALELKNADILDEATKRKIRYLAELKLTHLILPSDRYFDLDNDGDREAMQELFAFVRSYGMEPVPLVQLYSNATRVLGKCAELGIDCAEGGTGDTCPLITRMYDEIIEPVFVNIHEDLDPEYIHIGHDDITGFNQNPVDVIGFSPAELYAASVNTLVDLVNDVMPGTRIMIWADMIQPDFNLPRLQAPAPGSSSAPPQVTDLIPKDLTWNTYYPTSLPTVLAYQVDNLFIAMAQDGWTFTAGPGAADIGGYQAYLWMRPAMDLDAAGFVARSITDHGFEDDYWAWLPFAAELAWSFWAPDPYTEAPYNYQSLNEAYGSF